MIVLIATIYTLMYHHTLYYLIQVQSLEFKLWDSQNTTVSDFTIELNITHKMWNTYQKLYKQKKGKIDTLEHFITKEFEKKLAFKKKLGGDHGEVN